MANRKSRAGRPRAQVDRTKSGQPKNNHLRQAMAPTPEQICHRAVSLGIDPLKALVRHDVVKIICLDTTAGTALGRLTWRYCPDGSRERKVGGFGRVDPSSGASIAEQWITDDHTQAAEAYRDLWVRWHRINGMPNRNPKGQQFERKDGGHDHREASPIEAKRIAGLLHSCDEAMKQCSQHVLVVTAVDMVVIENVIPASLEAGERSTGLAALRRGLDAIHGVLCRGKHRRIA